MLSSVDNILYVINVLSSVDSNLYVLVVDYIFILKKISGSAMRKFMLQEQINSKPKNE